MEEFKIRLNDFLYNSGILGFYKILDQVDKSNLVQIEGNSLTVKKDALNDFENDYINTMLETFEEDTKWYSIINSKESIRQIQSESDKSKLEDYYKAIKRAMDSASYKSGYEIIKENSQINPYEVLLEAKNEKDNEKKKELLIRIIEHLEKYKEVYCMKDIIYTKINCFWSNMAFLNTSANKKNIKEEYKKVFVTPAQNYLKQTRNSEYTCIECGNKIIKKEMSGMSWLNDVGVDINRKKSGFWNFNEDTFLCPICNLIYSCIPLGFNMIGSNGIFVNNNESFMSLKRDNILNNPREKVTLQGTYHKVIHNYINNINQIGNSQKVIYEPKNIQVVERIGNKDNQYYEFSMLSKDKLEILKKSSRDFEKLLSTNIYQEVLTNLLQGLKQYKLIDKIIAQQRDSQSVRTMQSSGFRYINTILNIEACNMGGVKLEERKQWIEEMIAEGERLKIHFYKNNENKNKLEAYGFRIQNALKANNVAEFMKHFSLFYGSLGIPMPRCKGMKMLLENPEDFKLLGYAYVYGMGKLIDSKGEDKNEK